MAEGESGWDEVCEPRRKLEGRCKNKVRVDSCVLTVQPTLSLPIEYPPHTFFFYVLIPSEWKAFAKVEEECLL